MSTKKLETTSSLTENNRDSIENDREMIEIDRNYTEIFKVFIVKLVSLSLLIPIWLIMVLIISIIELLLLPVGLFYILFKIGQR